MSTGSRRPLAPPQFDPAIVRRDFPALRQSVHGRPLVYLDNAATTQKPAVVIDRLTRYYREENANVHRGMHALSERATECYEQARHVVARFLNARDPREIVFVRGTTEAINLVAGAYGRSRIGAADGIVVSAMEHHSNIVPWQAVCEERGARLSVIPISDAGEIDLDAFADLLTERTRIVSIAHVSNALGTINPIADIVRLARDCGSAVLVDGAQAAAHMPVDVQDLGCDFYACSGHKMFGPTGIGVLYGRLPLLEAMAPYQYGGDMIASVRFDGTEYQRPPHRFEAGTPHIAGAIGLAAAADYVSSLGLDRIAGHERALAAYATEALARVPGVRIVGQPAKRAGIVSFVMDGVHPHDIGTVLDREGVAIRAGHHCCQPLMERLGLPATARASFACYNTLAEVDALTAALCTARQVFG